MENEIDRKITGMLADERDSGYWQQYL